MHIVGPTIKNAPSNYLRLRHPWVLAGFDPMVQLIHVEDVARAMVEALRPGLKGVYNVVGSGRGAAVGGASASWGGRRSRCRTRSRGRSSGRCSSYRLANFPPPELDHIQFLCMVDGSRWTADVGWVPGHSMKDTIRSVDGERAAA